MKTEIIFYQVDDIVAKSIATLLLKVLEDQKKALIFCKNLEKIKEIDNILWQFSKTKFIPHTTIFDKEVQEFSNFTRQPVLISNKEENSNQADYLILSDKTSFDFIKNFSKVFYFYDSMMIDEIKNFIATINSEFKIKSYKKIDGKWQDYKF